MFGWKKEISPRRMPETSGAFDGGFFATQGLMAGTRVGTAMGWRSVEALEAGDLVLTFDHGMMPLVEVRRQVFWVSDAMNLRTVLIPAGAMGNSTDVELLTDQGVLIESDAACDMYGDPFAVVRAKALEGFRGITEIAAPQQMEIITLIFGNEEVIYADGGVLVHCPRAVLRLDEMGQRGAGYDVLDDQDADFLVQCMTVETRGGQFTAHPMAA